MSFLALRLGGGGRPVVFWLCHGMTPYVDGDALLGSRSASNPCRISSRPGGPDARPVGQPAVSPRTPSPDGTFSAALGVGRVPSGVDSSGSGVVVVAFSGMASLLPSESPNQTGCKPRAATGSPAVPPH